MQFKNKANEQTQTIDGRTIWLSRSVAVVSQVIIRHLPTNRYRTVIIKRGPASLGSIGEWCFPCGYLDYDETTFEAAMRETFEETGIDLISLQQQAHMDSDITVSSYHAKHE